VITVPLTAPAIKIRQKDIDIYLTTFKAKDLLENYSISWWKRDKKDGYQRPLRDSRIAQIKSFLTKDTGTFPTSVLANVRGDIQYNSIKKFDGNKEIGEITISDESLPLWVIDGQHRVEGLKAAIEDDIRFAKYPVIVSLFTLPDIYNEMTQFHIVNSRAKSVPTDLAQRHLYQMASKMGLPNVIIREGTRSALAAYVIPVVDKLANDQDSPWYQKIQLPDQARKKKGQVIKQRPLADSIQFIVKEKVGLRRDLDKLAKMLKDYWSAISKIFPVAFSDPANYTLQATPGTYSLHMIFPEVYDMCNEANDLSEESMRKVLTKMFEKTSEKLGAEINDDFWNKEVGIGNFLAQSTTQKMIRALAQYFREALWKE
jgi:DNA sulfur modification protein DndB